jgi:hypothetical protein
MGCRRMNGTVKAVRRPRQRWPPPKCEDNQEVRLSLEQRGASSEVPLSFRCLNRHTVERVVKNNRETDRFRAWPVAVRSVTDICALQIQIDPSPFRRPRRREIDLVLDLIALPVDDVDHKEISATGVKALSGHEALDNFGKLA